MKCNSRKGNRRTATTTARTGKLKKKRNNWNFMKNIFVGAVLKHKLSCLIQKPVEHVQFLRLKFVIHSGESELCSLAVRMCEEKCVDEGGWKRDFHGWFFRLGYLNVLTIHHFVDTIGVDSFITLLSSNISTLLHSNFFLHWSNFPWN